jgi:hypothetical protein
MPAGDAGFVQGMEAGIGRHSPARLDAQHDSPTRPRRDAPNRIFWHRMYSTTFTKFSGRPVSSIDEAERMKYQLIRHCSGQLRRTERPKDTRTGQVALAKTTSAPEALRIELLEIEPGRLIGSGTLGLRKFREG